MTLPQFRPMQRPSQTKAHQNRNLAGPPSTSTRGARIAISIAAVAALICVHAPASAQWMDEPEEERSPWSVGLRIGYGSSVASPTDDRPGQPTLLFGSAFTGSVFRVAPIARVAFSPVLALRIEPGMSIVSMTGFVEGPDFRQELTLRHTAIDLPLALDIGSVVGPLYLGGHLGFAPRFGISAGAEEHRRGNVPNPDAPALPIRTGVGVQLLVGGGVAIEQDAYRIPVEVRYARNLLYPNTTFDRFNDYQSDDDPSEYLVEATWMLIFSVGFEFKLGRRDPRPAHTPELAPVYVPPPPPPPPPPALPDHDGDGVPDAYDQCPIEPLLPGEVGPYPGCPTSGGIVTLFCDRIEMSAPIDFPSGSDQIDDSSIPILYLLADTLMIATNVRIIRIEGHTDDRGSASANYRLSEDRAWAVVDMLIELGVEPERLEAVGYGPDFPIESNSTAEGRAANRRVEIHIVENTTCNF